MSLVYLSHRPSRWIVWYVALSEYAGRSARPSSLRPFSSFLQLTCRVVREKRVVVAPICYGLRRYSIAPYRAVPRRAPWALALAPMIH